MKYKTDYERRLFPMRVLIWLRWMPVAYAQGCYNFVRWLIAGAPPYPRFAHQSDQEYDWFVRHGGGKWLPGRLCFTLPIGHAHGMMGNTFPIGIIIDELRKDRRNDE